MPEGEPKHWDNEYFDGKVRSIKTILGMRRATQGEIDPGEYEFTTETEERITVTSGQLEVKLPGEADFRRYDTGYVIEVPPNSSFTLRATEPVTYDCIYVDIMPPIVRRRQYDDEYPSEPEPGQQPQYVPDEFDGDDDDGSAEESDGA